MPFTPKFVDLVRNFTTSKGTGAVMPGAAVNGYAGLAEALSVGDQFYYCIQSVDRPQEREVGRGTLQADGSVARDPIAGEATNFSAGTKTIALVAAAEWFDKLETGGAGGAAIEAASVGALAAETGAAAGTARFLSEARREGLFKFTAGDLSAKVTADSAQGLYVAPASDPTGASGAWVRQMDGGPISPVWFGLAEANSGAANSAAVNAMLATLRGRASNITTNYQGLEPVRFPPGDFDLAETIEITDGTQIIEGADTGFPSARGTILRFPAGVTGIRVQRSNTSGATTVDGVTHRGGDGVIIRNLSLWGGYDASLTEGEFHGIHLRARAVIENVFITKFEGDGIYSATGTATGNDNNNNTRIVGGRSQNCRNGLFVNGDDSNIWTITGLDCSGNRQWGFWDSSFLGNSYFGCHSATNGLPVSGGPVSFVSHGGNRYSVVAGQEAGASTNAPSGTATDNSWWYYESAGGVSGSVPAWTSGATYRAGGAYHADGASGHNVFLGCYSESGQGQSQITAPSIVMGGLMSTVHGSATVIRSGIGGVAELQRGFRYENADGTKKYDFGSTTEANSDAILQMTHGTAAPSTHRLKYNGADLQLDYNNSNTARSLLITGPSTTLQFGTGAAVTHAFVPCKLILPEDGNGVANGNCRRLFVAAAAPSANAHAAGEFALNRAYATGAPFGWVCRTFGTPGTWDALYPGLSTSPTTGIGYMTGAGGAVTQATSKSTGVTLNKTTGQVTTNAAALAAATSVSFTMTNSAIAATDVVIVNIGSGASADSYQVRVDAVAAGSCRIQLRNVSAGSLSEALVLNFAIIKGVAA